MRLSVRQGDPGYHPAAHQTVVWFNGREWKGKDCKPAHTADEELGELHVYDMSRFTPDGEEFETIVLVGTVKLVVPDCILRERGD